MTRRCVSSSASPRREVGRECFQHDLVRSGLELDGLLEAQRAGADLGQVGTGCGTSSLEQANTEPLALDGSLDPCRNVQPLFADDLVLCAGLSTSRVGGSGTKRNRCL